MNLETRFIKLEHVRFTKSNKNLKVIQLSDIHINFMMVKTNRIKNILKSIKPDFIVLTGDYISSTKHIPNFLKFLNSIKDANIIYACLGNHEYKTFHHDPDGLNKFIGQMEALGVNVLQDSSCNFIKNSKNYNILGLHDLYSNMHNTKSAISSINPESAVCLALSHNPDIVYKLPKDKIDYLFSGHFHGGQIWAPFNIEFKLMRNEKLCKAGITRGLHKINGINLYINRGLGNICFPFRFLSRPEITVFYIP